MGRIAALAAGITAAVGTAVAVVTRRRSGGAIAPRRQGTGRGAGKKRAGGGMKRRAGSAATKPGGAGAAAGAGAGGTSRPTATAASEARQGLSTGAEAAASGSDEEAERFSDETAEGTASSGAASGADTTGGLPDRSESDLQAVKGIGAVSQERLQELGITTLSQVAAWTDEDVERIAEQIKISSERIRREDWVGQARAALDG